MTSPVPSVQAILFSGGLDSAVLLTYAANQGPVQPLYVSVGLAWETQERAAAEAVVASVASGEVRPLVTLDADMHDIYPATHWAIKGTAPAYDTPDEDVYIEGRNIVLLAKASVFMARASIHRVFLGPLAGNPFPDASAEFFGAMSRALSIGLDSPIEIATPFAAMHKPEVIKLGESLGVAMERSLSCMQPVGGVHCGRCSKCRERIEGFRAAGVEDRTLYAVDPPRSTGRL
jgi:7-cyano-7-deazaguanine synthase